MKKNTETTLKKHIQRGRLLSIRLMEDETEPEDAMVQASIWVDMTIEMFGWLKQEDQDRLTREMSARRRELNL